MDYLLASPLFIKVQDMCGRTGFFGNEKELLKKFVSNIDEKYLLSQFSHIYILVGLKNEETQLNPGEKTWNDLFDANEELKKTMDELGCVVLGYVLASDDGYIERIYTFLRGYNIASLMIDKLKTVHGIDFIPREITESSTGYWRHYYDLRSNEEIDQFILHSKINKDNIDWSNLYYY